MLHRRGFLLGLGAGLVAAPAIVRAASLMPVRGIIMPVEAGVGDIWMRGVVADYDGRTLSLSVRVKSENGLTWTPVTFGGERTVTFASAQPFAIGDPIEIRMP